MGEATYYLKARFASEKAAREAEVRFREVLTDLEQLNSDWQKLREDTTRTCTERIAELKAKHPLSGGLIDDQCPYDKDEKPDLSMNCLAGPLPDITGWFELSVSGDELFLYDTVWHSTDWEALTDWLKRLGAEVAGYISEEDAQPDYFGQIEMG